VKKISEIFSVLKDKLSRKLHGLPSNGLLLFLLVLASMLLICILAVSVEKTVETSSGGKILRWGLKRNGPGKAPDIDPGAGELLAKYGALYIGDTQQKKIYLTFDEGYENGNTEKILDVLRENNVKAIFFITGAYLDRHSDLVRRMVEEGHEVGNHTVNHPSLPQCSPEVMEKEILDLEREFRKKFNRGMRFLRPPNGEYSELQLQLSQKLSYINLFWSFAYADWDTKKQKGEDYAFNMVTQNLHNGAVILLHAVSDDNAKALDRIIKEAIRQGYSFGTPDELAMLAARKDNEKQE